MTTKKKAKKKSAKKSGSKAASRNKGQQNSPKQKQVKIGPAKGRPMLQWVGKKPLSHVVAFPAQHIESFDPRHEATIANPGGLLFHGDNKEVLAHLLANGFRGKIDLIYIDPPFDSGADYVRRVTLRGKSATRQFAGEGYQIGEQVQYTDIWANDNYLQFMYERFVLLKELLSDRGSLYLHCDWNRSHLLRVCLEEVFGASNLRNEIIWQRTASRSDSTTFNHIHDTIYFVTKGDTFCWNQQFEAYDQGYVEERYSQVDDNGRRFTLDNITSPNPRPNMTYEWKGFQPPPNGWRYSKETMTDLDAQGLIYYPDDKSKRPRLIRYLSDEGRPLRSVWTDVFPVNSQASERLGFPTQKPEALLGRLIATSSTEGSFVLDCFIGSGTTAAVAQKLGRRWIGCDINKGAIQTVSKRLQTVVLDQIADRDRAAASEEAKGPRLFDDDESDDSAASTVPAQLNFSVYRVNDYDLQVQHNEAVALACEHIGVTRTKSDPYFDGHQGKRLVKVIPFNHPLSPTDLEQLRDELKARPEEERDILLVCLGKEFAADAWLEDWNRMRRKGDVPNRIKIIELRTDPKYGKLLAHKPASAKVEIKRKSNMIHVKVQDFVSPSIVERLEQHNGLLSPQIEDWRSMVDCLMIDTAYDGDVFNICLSDIPLKKSDLVEGSYELEVTEKKAIIAVKIIDMLGEEVLVTSTG